MLDMDLIISRICVDHHPSHRYPNGGFHKWWGYPKSSIVHGIFSRINQPFMGTPINGNLHLDIYEMDDDLRNFSR